MLTTIQHVLPIHHILEDFNMLFKILIGKQVFQNSDFFSFHWTLGFISLNIFTNFHMIIVFFYELFIFRRRDGKTSYYP